MKFKRGGGQCEGRQGGPFPKLLVPPLRESKAVGWRQRVQLVAQG